MKKIIFSAALLMGLATVSFAGNPKGDSKSEKTDAATTASTTKESHTYWVLGRDGDGNYNLTKDQPEQECDLISPDPCRIMTDEDLDEVLKIPESDVSGQNGVQVETFQTL